MLYLPYKLKIVTTSFNVGTIEFTLYLPYKLKIVTTRQSVTLLLCAVCNST